jgi:hypothetical protein
MLSMSAVKISLCPPLMRCERQNACETAGHGVFCDARDGIHSEKYTDSQATSFKVNADCKVEAILGLIFLEGSVCLEGS